MNEIVEVEPIRVFFYEIAGAAMKKSSGSKQMHKPNCASEWWLKTSPN